MQPKVSEIPGIPFPIQEMSLDQYLDQLGADHYARKQYAELKANALRAVELANQVIDLQGKLIAVKLPEPGSTEMDPPPEAMRHVVPEPKKPCPACGKMISSRPGPWATHQKQHGLGVDKTV